VQWNREQYLSMMTFGEFERPMFTELFGPLVGLDAEWREQGASEDEINMVAFDWDYVRRTGAGVHCGQRGQIAEPRVIEDTPDLRIEIDGLGRRLQLEKRSATIALPVADWPVQTMDDWQRIKWMYEHHEDRVDEDALREAKRQRDEDGVLVVGGMPGGFDLPRRLMGEEVCCMAYYEQPEMMHDIAATLRETACRVLERAVEICPLDQLSVHEDFAGKSGPLVGPSQIDQFIKPYFASAWQIVQSAGGQIFRLDTDGNINSVIDALLDCGLTHIYPMEPAAGMDIVQLHDQYGKRLMMSGGIDKFVLARGHDAIDAELEYKLQPKMRERGGMVFSLDHRIPNGTPLEAYRYYVKRGREILGLPPLDPSRQGWARMEF